MAKKTVTRKKAAKKPRSSTATARKGSAKSTKAFKEILFIIKERTGVDLTEYKMSTLQRRIERQMSLNKTSSYDKYLKLLRSSEEAVDTLFQDLFIHVTEFFRDKEAYASLKKIILPGVVKNKRPGDLIRIWVPACSTGEEVYSIAMTLMDYLEKNNLNIRPHIFATDICRISVHKARKGLYSEASLTKLKPEFRSKYFEKTKDGYKVIKRIRELCVFSVHDLNGDPPFSRLDLISCRNVLIYFGPDLQKRVLESFNFGLHPGGYLWLGSSESLGPSNKLFRVLDKKHRIFSKTNDLEPIPVKAKPRAVKAALREVTPKKDYVKTMREEFEASQEELMSANEELQASNEELQSMNEELETAQEELQSANEELVTMNDELGVRNTELQVLNEKLAESEERFRLIVENVRDYAIFMLDANGCVISWNEGAKKFKGYEASEIMGKHFSNFYTDEDKANQKPQWEIDTAIASGRVEDEGWRVRKDGSKFWANVIITKVTGRDGKLLGFTKVTRDLTERRRAEEELRKSEERLRLMISAVKDYAIFMLDPDGIIASWNEGAKRIKGYEAKEIIGAHFSKFYQQSDIDRNHPEYELKIARAEGKYEEEGWRIRKDGTKFWANVTITRLDDPQGNIIGFVKVTRDLTERKENEESLKEAYKGLEQKVQERTSDLQTALKTRDEFLSIASHELKTPLTSLKLQLQISKRRLNSENCLETMDETKKSIESAVRQVNSLNHLVEDLLDVSRIQTGVFKLSCEEMDLNELIEDVVHRFAHQIVNAGCKVELYLGRGVKGIWDKYRLEQVIINLVFNAIKYAPGRPINIFTSRESQNVQMIIEDLGPGIPQDKHDKIFERFERVNTDHQIGGMGLGLFITRKIVEAHQGRIKLESDLGKGARFFIELPTEPEV